MHLGAGEQHHHSLRGNQRWALLGCGRRRTLRLSCCMLTPAASAAPTSPRDAPPAGRQAASLNAATGSHDFDLDPTLLLWARHGALCTTTAVTAVVVAVASRLWHIFVARRRCTQQLPEVIINAATTGVLCRLLLLLLLLLLWWWIPWWSGLM